MAALRRVPAVAEKLSGAERVGGIRGVGPLARRVRRVTGDGFLLVGDAAGFLDPFTGDGIFDALRGAQLAAPIASAALRSGSVSAGDLDPYRAERRRVFLARQQVRNLVQGFIHVPVLMDYATARLDRREDLGQTLTGVLGNFRPARHALSPLFLARLLRP
jgi:flavin-dependent dehydrogenase